MDLTGGGAEVEDLGGDEGGAQTEVFSTYSSSVTWEGSRPHPGDIAEASSLRWGAAPARNDSTTRSTRTTPPPSLRSPLGGRRRGLSLRWQAPRGTPQRPGRCMCVRVSAAPRRRWAAGPSPQQSTRPPGPPSLPPPPPHQRHSASADGLPAAGIPASRARHRRQAQPTAGARLAEAAGRALRGAGASVPHKVAGWHLPAWMSTHVRHHRTKHAPAAGGHPLRMHPAPGGAAQRGARRLLHRRRRGGWQGAADRGLHTGQLRTRPQVGGRWRGRIQGWASFHQSLRGWLAHARPRALCRVGVARGAAGPPPARQTPRPSLARARRRPLPRTGPAQPAGARCG